MPLPPCEYRQDMPADGIFYCRCPSYHTPGQLVNDKLCGMCTERLKTGKPKRPLAPTDPSLVQRAKNIAGAVVKHTRTGRKTAPEIVQRERLSVCQGCEYFNGHKCQHKACGCTAFKLKLSWASSTCPVGKWGAVTPEQTGDTGQVESPETS